MNIQECYTALGGDYSGVLGRLRSEKLVLKFVLKFLDDDSFGLLMRSLDEGNVSEAFRAAHTIKGMCQNLSFTRLAESSSLMTEALRAGNLEEAAGLCDKVSSDYRKTIEAITALKESE